MSDSAKKSIITASGYHLGTTFLEDTWDKDVIGIDELQRFLEVKNVFTLYATIEEIENNKRLKFFRRVTKESYDRIVIFTKTKPCVPSDDAVFSNIQITSLSGSPTLALYQSLSHVYAPFLYKQRNQNVQRHIANLQNDLRTIIFSDTPNAEENAIPPTVDSSSLTVITSLEHEVAYWNTTLSAYKKGKTSKTAMTSYRDILTTIARDFSIIDGLPIDDVEELLEKAHNALDDLWKISPPYPSDRMKHIMDIIASDIWRFSSSHLKKCSIWKAEYGEVADTLLQHISIAEKWLATCKQLTEIFWPTYPTPWKEKIYQPKDLVDFVEVLRKVVL